MKKILSIAAVAVLLAACQTKKDKNFIVNDEVSKAEWKGSAPDHFHVGSFTVTGKLTTDANGVVKSGDFIIPISSIRNFDLKDPVRQALLADLKDNFFKIAANPTAKFHLTKASSYSVTGAAANSSEINGSNYVLTGDFTMLGQTHLITFPAKIILKGDSLLTEAKFDIDRTKWGMKNYDDPKQKLYILPTVNIHLNVRAARAKANLSSLAFIGFN